MNKILKWALIISGAGIAVYIGINICLFAFLGGVFDTHYSKKDLIDNYNLKTGEIVELKNYVDKIVPDSMSVDIEFDGNRTLEIFHVVEKNGYWNANWNIKIDSPKADTLLQKLGWTSETLSTLKEKLDNANCISIESGEPCTIGFQRSGMGKYSYKVFDQPLNDSLKKVYNDNCTYIFYKNNIVLEYGGGAIGRQCFESSK
jgi:hypothetical protein